MICEQCGAAFDEMTCEDCFNQMLIWEFDNTEGAGAVHHLTVLAYHLQHPRTVSAEWITKARDLLVEFLENGASPQHIRREWRDQVDSGKRSIKFKGQSMPLDIQWTMTIQDVLRHGLTDYCATVETWARSVLAAL